MNLQMTSQLVWNMSLCEHFFKVLRLNLEARIRDPDPHRSEMYDPDPHSHHTDKQDPDQHQTENQDPDPMWVRNTAKNSAIINVTGLTKL
jgi:hypothetical protein